MDKYYLRIEDGNFGFVLEGIHEITDSDIAISSEDHKNFFELQSQGKQFRLKEVPDIESGLFGYVEEYVPEVVEVQQEQGIEDYILDLEYRISKIELGVE